MVFVCVCVGMCVREFVFVCAGGGACRNACVCDVRVYVCVCVCVRAYVCVVERDKTRGSWAALTGASCAVPPTLTLTPHSPSRPLALSLTDPKRLRLRLPPKPTEGVGVCPG